MPHRQFFQTTEVGSPTWQEEMLNAGKAMGQNNVGHVIFTQGTFANKDPFGLNDMLQQAIAALPLPLQIPASLKKRNYTQKVADRFFRDTGNFTSDYVSKFEKGINHDIKCSRFVWSGRKNNIARVRAAIRLCHLLAKTYNKDKKTLLIGHGHAGQVFALVTTLLEKSAESDKLRIIIAEIPDTAELNIKNLDKSLATIADIQLDIVTFGMPVRYHWARTNRQGDSAEPFYKLLCVVNDRDNDVHLCGLLFTQDGDYVQQFGKDDTDFPIATNIERELDERLKNMLPQIKNSEDQYARQHPLDHDKKQVSKTVLIDYQDDTHYQTAPNFISTAFGHGIYTKENAMLFNTEMIVSHLYSIIEK